LLNSSESHLASELERIKKILDTKDGVVKDWFRLVFTWEIFVEISAEKELQQMCEYEVVKDWRIGLAFFVRIFRQKKNFSRCVNTKLWKIDLIGLGLFWGDFCGNFQQKKTAQNNPADVWIDHHHHQQQQLPVFYLLFADWKNTVRSFARPFSLWQQGLDALLWER